jgi:NAD(P)-dependent dehydrogenase (short-subunit alcohol dehydrogenase family)
MIEELFGLKEKVAVVLGGTSGIGKAVTIEYARARADVVASSRRRETVQQTATELEAYGARTLVQECDIRSFHSVEALLQATLKHFQRVDILWSPPAL